MISGIENEIAQDVWVYLNEEGYPDIDIYELKQIIYEALLAGENNEARY